MTEFSTDLLKFANRSAPGASAGIAKMFGTDIGGVSSLVVQSSDGAQHQLAPTAAGAGSVPYSALMNLLTLGGGATIADQAAAQNVFPTARDTITLQTGCYKLRGHIHTVRTGTVSCSVSCNFAGTATYGTSGIMTYGKNSASLSSNVWIGQILSPASSTVINTAATVLQRSFKLDGLLVVTGAGTFIPQISFSVAPGSTTVISTLSYMELVRVGATSFTQQGGWT